jgi:D-tyrosyl-tRNA(Tyr) deacylase
LRALVQRVSRASVTVDGEPIAAIELGLLVLLGVAAGDGEAEVRRLADKLAGLRVFDDQEGRMNQSLIDLGDGAAALCVSQFTLYGDVRRGLRPSFTGAAEPGRAEQLYEALCAELRGKGVRVESGRFGARMSVSLVNEGPVTLMVET